MEHKRNEGYVIVSSNKVACYKQLFEKSEEQSIQLENAVTWSKSNLNVMNIYEEKYIKFLDMTGLLPYVFINEDQRRNHSIAISQKVFQKSTLTFAGNTILKDTGNCIEIHLYLYYYT